jgi:hypothetical protein
MRQEKKAAGAYAILDCSLSQKNKSIVLAFRIRSDELTRAMQAFSATVLAAYAV